MPLFKRGDKDVSKESPQKKGDVITKEVETEKSTSSSVGGKVKAKMGMPSFTKGFGVLKRKEGA